MVSERSCTSRLLLDSAIFRKHSEPEVIEGLIGSCSQSNHFSFWNRDYIYHRLMVWWGCKEPLAAGLGFHVDAVISDVQLQPIVCSFVRFWSSRCQRIPSIHAHHGTECAHVRKQTKWNAHCWKTKAWWAEDRSLCLRNCAKLISGRLPHLWEIGQTTFRGQSWTKRALGVLFCFHDGYSPTTSVVFARKNWGTETTRWTHRWIGTGTWRERRHDRDTKDATGQVQVCHKLCSQPCQERTTISGARVQELEI